MVEIVVSAVVGGLVSWAITHYYDRRAFVRVPAWARPLMKRLPKRMPSRAELRKVFREVLAEVRLEASEPEEEIDFDELEECPKCGSDDLESGDDENARGRVFETIECLSCGWRDKREL
jgi:Zn ribbon nucleic-acid-binding protein